MYRNAHDRELPVSDEAQRWVKNDGEGKYREGTEDNDRFSSKAGTWTAAGRRSGDR